MSALMGLFKKTKDEEEDKGAYQPPLKLDIIKSPDISQSKVEVGEVFKPNDNNITKEPIDLLSELKKISMLSVINNPELNKKEKDSTGNSSNEDILNLKIVNSHLQDIDIPLSNEEKILTSILSKDSSSNTPQQKIEQLQAQDSPSQKKPKPSTLAEPILDSLVSFKHLML